MYGTLQSGLWRVEYEQKCEIQIILLSSKKFASEAVRGKMKMGKGQKLIYCNLLKKECSEKENGL